MNWGKRREKEKRRRRRANLARGEGRPHRRAGRLRRGCGGGQVFRLRPRLTPRIQLHRCRRLPPSDHCAALELPSPLAHAEEKLKKGLMRPSLYEIFGSLTTVLKTILKNNF